MCGKGNARTLNEVENQINLLKYEIYLYILHTMQLNMIWLIVSQNVQSICKKNEFLRQLQVAACQVQKWIINRAVSNANQTCNESGKFGDEEKMGNYFVWRRWTWKGYVSVHHENDRAKQHQAPTSSRHHNWILLLQNLSPFETSRAQNIASEIYLLIHSERCSCNCFYVCLLCVTRSITLC